MTTTALSRSALHTTSVTGPKFGWIGRGPYVLSLVLVVVSLSAALSALLMPELIRAPAVSVGNLQGTAFVMAALTLPILVGSMVLVRRTPVGLVLWLGALGSIAYQSVLFLFGVAFNSFFFLYVGMLSLSVWAIVALAGRSQVNVVGSEIAPGAPVRIVAGYLLINALLFFGLWVGSTLPAVLANQAPAFLEGTGMLTGPVQIIDFAFTLPLMVLAALLLLRRRPWGYVLAGSLLVMLTIETASIGVDQWMGSAADPSSPASSAAMTPVFALLTLIGAGVFALFVRRGPRQTG